jgi:hypothetical protein
MGEKSTEQGKLIPAPEKAAQKAKTKKMTGTENIVGESAGMTERV